MKKFLLFAAVAFSATAMAQEGLTDITPAAYDWANMEVGTKMSIKHYAEKWNTDFTFSWQLGGSEYLENGGCISANATKDPTIYENGTAVVDLGEGIGKVMAINGAISNAQQVLGFTTDAAIDAPMQINIFTNPDNTPKFQWIRVKVVLNIFSNEIKMDDAVITSMYMMSGDNDDLGSWLNGGDNGRKIHSGDFIAYDEEGDPELDENENYVYDKNRWMTYQYDVWNRDDYAGYGKEGTTSVDIPMKLKLWMPQGGLAKSTIFIKELKFYAIDGATDKDEKPEYADALHITFGPCPNTEVDAIKNINATANADAIYNIAGQRVNEATKGLYIIGGKKVIK